MRWRRLEPNLISFNAATSACAKGAQWRQALEVRQEAQDSGLELNAASDGAAAEAARRAADWSQAPGCLQPVESASWTAS